MQRGWGEGAWWARCAVGLWFLCTNSAHAQPAPNAASPQQPKGRGAIIVKVVTESDGKPDPRRHSRNRRRAARDRASGADGKARLDVPPGTYAVKATAEKYTPVTIQKLTVVVGKAVGATAKLRPKEEATTQSKQTVEVTGVVKEASEATQLQQRKEATTVGDSVGHGGDRARRPTRAPPRW